VPRSASPKPSVPQDSITSPVAPEEFASAAAPLFGRGCIALAVSGGADSLALMHLANEWCRREGRELPLAVTVDHGLRSSSAEEARDVHTWAQQAGIQHTTLKWQHDGPTANLQSVARQARYSLIGNWMRTTAVETLATGHTADDQAETFLMRLARGSGLEGLSGMKALGPFPSATQTGLMMARPLLGFSHARLVETLRARNLPWIEDPSNDDMRFLRVQVRKLMPQLASLGITAGRLTDTAAHLSRANSLVGDLAREIEEQAVEAWPWGYVLLDARRLGNAPEELACRVLARTLKAVGGAEYPPEFSQTMSVLEWLRDPEGVAGRTLGGCRLARRPEGRVLVCREDAALERDDPVCIVRAGEAAIWDGRFSVHVPTEAGPGEFQVKAVGAHGLTQLGPNARLPAHEPRRLAALCPAIWKSGVLVSAPNLDFHREFRGAATFLGLHDTGTVGPLQA
jgi:tRNA(Ile)-lysidine synthase